MTTPRNQQTDQPVSMPQTMVEAIDACLTEGLPVFDANGEPVGHVKMYTIAAGYLVVGTGPFEENDLYLPFRLIRSIDPHDVFLAEYKDVLARYANPPTIRTVVEHRLVPGPHGAMTEQTCEVQVVASGYDEQPTEFNRYDVGNIMDRLAVGMVVYDARGERLGEVTRYDAPRSLMVVEKGIFKPKALLVPFSAIREIHPGMCCIYLAVPRSVLVQEHAILPVDA